MSRSRTALSLALVVALIGSFAVLEAAPQDVKNTNAPQGPPSTRPGSGGADRPQVFGTIFYDDGVLTHLPGTEGTWGNQFDTANGTGVLVSGSVTRMSFFLFAASGNVFISVYGPVSGTAASPLISVSVPPNNGSSAFNSWTFASPVNYSGPSFLAGVWYIAGDSVGLATGTTGGQGHHGMFIEDIVGTGFSLISGINGMVGASGNVVIPVELMDFEIE